MPEPFPTMEQVEKANRVQIARWHCFLPLPKTTAQQNITDRIADRCLNMGGLTPGLRKKIGFIEDFHGSRTARSNPRSVVEPRAAHRSFERIAGISSVGTQNEFKPKQFSRAS